MSHTKKPTIEKIILALLGLLALAALVRTMFLGLEIDEEYALSLSFRLVRGDRLFYSMWEPHQLAALPPALLIGLFTAVAGTTTGVLLFVRGAVLAVKLALAVWFYRSLRVALGGRCAYLLALAVLAFTPKWFLGPDYVSQQFHFTLAAFLFLYGYYAPGPRQYRGLWRVAAGGVCACLSFLAYPQTLAAAPVLMLALLLLGRGSADKCRGLWVFALTCAVCGGAFVVYVLQGMGFDFAALLARADLILHDPQYDFTTADRLAMLRSKLSAVIGNCWLSALAGVALAAAGMLFGERRGFARSLEKALWYTAFFLSLWCTAYCLRAQELDFRYMCPAFALAGGWTFWCDRREADHRPLRRLLFWLGWLPGIAAYLFILRSTLIALPTTFMYLFWPALCGAAALALKSPAAPHRRRQTQLLLLCMLLAAALLLSLVACGGKQSTATTEADASAENGGSTEATATAYKDTLIWAQGADVTSLDPHQGKETPAVEVTCQIFDTLVTVDAETNEIVPQIAESWEQTDAQTYVFKIRQGIKFHDGSDLTAEDVKFSLDRARNSAAVSYIVNFIEDVTVDDEYTVTVKTNAPYSPTLRNLAIPFAAIVPKAVVEADEDAFILNPVGSGPYCFVEWKQGDHVTLKAFDDYYAGKAATENLIMKVIPETSQRSIALETGEIDLAYDLAVNDIPKINDNDKLMVYEIPSLTCWYVSMNMNKEPFNNPLVREALAMAIDRQTIIDTINAGSGQPADAIIAPAVFGYYSTGVPEYNPEKAKELLSEAGYPDGFNERQMCKNVCFCNIFIS